MRQKVLRTIKRLFFPLAIIFIATTFTGAYFSDSVSITNNSISTGREEPTPGKVVISEVYYNNNAIITDNQWVELYNGGDEPFDLTAYQLRYGSGNYYTFPAFTLNGKSFVVIHIHTIGINSPTDLFTGTVGSGTMSRIAGSVVLYHFKIQNSGTPVDFVEYSAGGQIWESAAVTTGIWTAGDFVPSVTYGHSIELIDKNIDTNHSTDWHDQSTPTPGS